MSESYTVLYRLVGHESDVNGLAWSADGHFLASCGIEGKVLVWEVATGFALIRTLETQPKRPVKGLVWDPLGHYLAAQASDGTLLIWRTMDWRLVTSVSCFDCGHDGQGMDGDGGAAVAAAAGGIGIGGGEYESQRRRAGDCLMADEGESMESLTYFSRPAWSPDGRLLCLPDSLNRGESVALLVERNRWTAEQSLVGHAAAIQVAQFSPRLYVRPMATAPPLLLVALGAQDGMISLWSSVASRPVVVLTGVFEHAVMDLTWSPDGRHLWAASYDGTVAEMRLDALGELLGDGAYAADDEKQASLMAVLSGGGVKDMSGGSREGGIGDLPTSVGQVHLRAMTKTDGSPRSATEHVMARANPDDDDIKASMATALLTKDATDAEAKVSTDTGTGTGTGTDTMNTSGTTMAMTTVPPQVSPQLESRLKNGKRRITPQLLTAESTGCFPSSTSVMRAEGMVSGTSSSSLPSSSAAAPSYSVVLGKAARKSWLRGAAIKARLVLGEPGGGGGGGRRTGSSPLPPVPGGTYEITQNPKDMTTGSARICRLASAGDGRGRGGGGGGGPALILWEERVEGLIVAAVVSSFSAGAFEGLILATSRHQLLLFSGAGRRLLPPLILPAGVCQLLAADDLLVAVLENGLFYLWRLPHLWCILQEELPPMELPGELLKLDYGPVGEDHVLQFVFGNNTRLIYSTRRRAFFQADGFQVPDALLQTVWGPLDEETAILALGGGEGGGPSLIPQILAADDRELRAKGLAHIEAQLAAAQLTGETARALPWLIAYARRIALEEAYERAREITSELLGSEDMQGQEQGRGGEQGQDKNPSTSTINIGRSKEVRRMVAACLATSASPMIRSLAERLAQ